MKAKIDKFNGWLNAHMSEKAFFGLLMIALGLYVIFLLLTSLYDTDMYFLIASGNEMLENGFIYKNIWTIDSNSSIIIQQWLYDVLLAFANRFGFGGLVIFASLQLCAFFGLFWHFLSLRDILMPIKCLFVGIIVVFGQIYLFSLRPELVTLTLLLAECVCLEHYKETRKNVWLIYVVLIMFLEINLHASMWPVHYAIMLAYIVPSFYLPMTLSNRLNKCVAPLLFTSVGMTAVMFVNPYGAEGVAYIIKSFSAHTFDYIQIRELAEPTFLSGPGATILLAMVLVGICLKFKVLRSVTCNMAFGFIALSVDALRNNMFLMMAYLFLLRDFADCLQIVKVDWKKDVKNYLWVLLIAFNIFLTFMNYSAFTTVWRTGFDSVATEWNRIYTYIQEDYNEDMHVFTGFNCGAYFEYKGMKNLYMDARPELYTDIFTGDKNILKDYAQYCIYGFNNKNRDIIIEKSDIDRWFTSYDFDYVIVSLKTEMFLNSYMMNQLNYVLVEDASNMDYALYKRISI